MNDDLISRQAAIEAIKAECEWLDENIQDSQHHYHMMNETARILSLIGRLPAVQLEEKTANPPENPSKINDNAPNSGENNLSE